MKRLLSLLLSVVLCLSCILSLSSCHGRLQADEGAGGDYSSSLEDYVISSDFDEGKKYEVVFWAKVDGNATQTAIYKRAISEFEALYPNVKVKLKLFSDYGRLYSEIITNIQTETTPNIAISYPDHVATYLTGEEIVIPLDSLMTDEKYGLGGSEVRFDSPEKDEIIPEFLEEGKINGRYYAMPYMRSTEACYVNRDLVEALGFTLPEVLTWDFMFEVARAALEKDEDGKYKVNGQTVLKPIIYKSTDNMMIQYLEQSGAGLSTERGEVMLFNDTTRALLSEVYSLTRDEAFTTFKVVSYPGDFFNREQCIFAIDSTAGATWIGSNAPHLDIPENETVDFETVVMPVPQVNPSRPKMISQGPSMCLFNKEDEGEVLASWLFMQYLLTNGIQLDYSYTEGYIPVTSKAHSSAEYSDYLSRAGEDNDLYYDVKISAAKLLLENTENTFVTPVFNGSADLRSAAGQLIEDTCLAARRGDKFTQAEITKLFDKIISLFKLDRLEVNMPDAPDDEEGTETPEYSGLPAGSLVLIVSLGVIDAFIVGYLLYGFIKKRREKSK